MYNIIFSHSFAKAFWGNRLVEVECGTVIKKDSAYAERLYDKMDAWMYHLQRMVLEKEPLKYLERFLEK